MSVSHVNTQTASRSLNATSVAPSKPTGVQDGDVLIGSVVCPSGRTITPPDGFTEIGTQFDIGTMRLGCFARVLRSVGNEPTSYVFTISGASAHISGIVGAYRGVHPIVPVNATATQSATINDTAIHAPTVTPLADGFVVVMWGSVNATAQVTVTAGSSLTKRGDVDCNNNPFFQSAHADETCTKSSATGVLDGTMSGAVVSYGARSIALSTVTEGSLSESKAFIGGARVLELS